MVSFVSSASGTSRSHALAAQAFAENLPAEAPAAGEDLEASPIFGLACTKITEAFKTYKVFSHSADGLGLKGCDAHGIDDQAVRALAFRLFSFIQMRGIQTGFPIDVNTMSEEELNEWIEGAVPVELNGTKTFLLLNEKAHVAEGGESYVYGGIRGENDQEKIEGVQGIQSYCAVKYLKETKNIAEIQRRDVLLSKICQSPYLVHYYGAVEVPTEDAEDEMPVAVVQEEVQECLIEEWCGESLFGLYQRAFDKDDAKSLEKLQKSLIPFVQQILSGIAFMHAQNIIHGDIKLDNILLAMSGDQVRISDLNGAVELPGRIRAGTLSCYAPEQIVEMKFLCAFILPKAGIPSDEDVPEIVAQPDFKKSEVWQAMLTIAQMSKGHLSEPFRNRIEEYIAKADEIESTAEDFAETKFTQGTSAYRALKGKYFADVMDSYIRSLSREGLFSDLVAEKPLETLLVGMSFFNPEHRITSAQAFQYAMNDIE